MPGFVRRQQFSAQMITQPSNLDYSLQQIPYPCPDLGFEFANSSDRLNKTRVPPYRPAKQASKQRLPQQSVLPVPDLTDVDALLAKPRFSADTFDPDPRFQLFEQKSVYDKLPGSYVDQPLGTLYPNALIAELNHTLAEAWRFNPVALSTRRARETACELACTPGHGLNREAISWVRSIGLSRVQALSRETEADDVAAKSWLLYEHYAELYADPSGSNHTSTLQEEIEDFYNPLSGASDPSNPYDPRHTHNVSGPSPQPEPEPEPEPQHVDGTEFDKDLNGLNINTMRSSLPARRGWLGGMPTPVSTADPSRHSSVCLDHGYGAASLPTPDTGISFAAAHPSDGSTVAQGSSMISPPLSGVNFVPASHNYHGVMIPADHAMPSPAQLNMSCSPPNNTTPVKQSSYQDHDNLALGNTPTFEARLAPLRNPKQIGKRLALLGDDEEIEWGPRGEGPYDFIDFCSASLESERSDGSEPTVIADGIDGAAHLQAITPKANGMDGAASIETPALDGHYVESACPYGTTMSDEVTDEAPTGAESTQDWHFRIESLEAINTGAASSGHTTKQIASSAMKGANERPTPKGTSEQAFELAQDLEQSIDSAVSQTASLARVLGKPSSPVLPELAIAVPKAQGLQKYMECHGDLGQSTNSQKQTELSPVHDGNKDPQTQSNLGSTQTESVDDEAHLLSVNTFTTPVPQHDLNHQTAILTKPKAIDFTPEYNSTSEEADGANLDSLSVGIFSSPTNRTQGGQNALSLYVRETSSHPNLYAYDDASMSTSMSMSISSAGSVSPEPEDLALTPTNTEFGLGTLTPSDDLEDVSLIADSFSTTSSTKLNGIQQSYGPNLVSAYSSYVNAFGPPSSSYYTTPTPALTTPKNNTPPNPQQYNPLHVSTPYHAHTLMLPSTTPGTPTPAPNPSHQHHSKNSPSAMLRHRNPSMDAKMRKSVKNVFESKKLGSRSPSPGKETRSDNDDGVIVGRKFIMENGQPMKRTHSSPAKFIPAHAAPLASMTGYHSQDIAFSAASIGMARTKSQDQIAQAVVVPGKRKSTTKTDGMLGEGVVEDVDSEQVRKRLRRSIRMSGNGVLEGV